LHFGILLGLAAGDEVVLQATVEVAHANDAIGNGEDEEENRDDGEGCESLSNGNVVLTVSGLINSNQLEDEICETAKVEDKDYSHAGFVLLLGKVGSCKQNANRDGNRGNRQSKLGVGSLGDNDDELNNESEEKEKIKLEQGNVDLRDDSLVSYLLASA
jgi:hypothetical protein